MRNNIKRSSYRIAVGVAQYIEAVSKKSTVTYKPTRTGDDVTKQILSPVFDKHHDEVIEDRTVLADGSARNVPDWIDAD